MKNVTITTAIALTSAQRKTLVDAIEQKHGKVQVEEVINPNVIGGLKLTIDSNQIDATSATKFEQLQSKIS